MLQHAATQTKHMETHLRQSPHHNLFSLSPNYAYSLPCRYFTTQGAVCLALLNILSMPAVCLYVLSTPFLLPVLSGDWGPPVEG